MFYYCRKEKCTETMSRIATEAHERVEREEYIRIKVSRDAKKEIAKRMKSKNKSVDEIIYFTELTKEEIESL